MMPYNMVQYDTIPYDTIQYTYSTVLSDRSKYDIGAVP